MRFSPVMAVMTLVLMVNILRPAWSQGTSWTGYVVDRVCSASYQKTPKPLDALHKHENSCSLKPVCEKAGYALFTDGHWYNLDTHGNKLAHEAIARSIRKRGFYAIVVGDLKGDTIAVTRLREVIDTPAPVHVK